MRTKRALKKILIGILHMQNPNKGWHFSGRNFFFEVEKVRKNFGFPDFCENAKNDVFENFQKTR